MKLYRKQYHQQKGLQMENVEDTQNNKLDLFLLSRQVAELCNQIIDCGIPDNDMGAKLEEISQQRNK